MKKSFRRKVTLAFTMVITLALIMMSILNIVLLPQYYSYLKIGILEKSFQMLDNDAGYDETSLRELRHFCVNNNLYFAIADSQFQVTESNSSDAQRLGNRVFIYSQVPELSAVMDEKAELIKINDEYQVHKILDTFSGVNYMELLGKLPNDEYFIVRCPIESIREGAEISNRFFLISGFLALCGGLAAIWLITRKMMHPLSELTDISKKMAALDFDAKYKSGGEDEIGMLGHNFNLMSTKLEDTITELKTANNELQKDIKKKIENEEMRQEFLSNVTHELKTPLALIQGYAEGLKDGISDDPESMDFYCEVIIDESNKMNQMVKKLLVLNQLESGNDQVIMDCFDLTELISGVLHTTKILLDQKDVKIIFQQDAPVMVWADEFKVEEIISNYLTNALNHIDENKTIEVSIERMDDKIKTTVFNSGKPIPEEDIDRLWDKFYKVDKARTRAYGGSGIGLSIVKAIVDSFNQTCGVNNYENGVAFWFTLEAK